MPARSWVSRALTEMRIPGRPTPYIESYAPNVNRPLGRRANGNFSTQWERALLVQGRYPTAEGFTTANPDFEYEIAWNTPEFVADLASRSWAEVLIWNDIYCTEEHGVNHLPGWIDNTRIVWWDFQLWLKSKATGAWSRLAFSDDWTGHPISPTFVHEDFARVWEDARYESSGYRSIRLRYDQNAPYASVGSPYWAYHGYSGGIQTFNAADVADVVISAKVSKVLHNPNAFDDRDFAKFAVAIGADYYPTPRIYYYPSVGISAHKAVNAKWPQYEYVICHTMTEAQLFAPNGYPAFFANLYETYDDTGVPPVVPPPVVVPPSAAPAYANWFDVLDTGASNWMDAAEVGAAAPTWGSAIQLTATIGAAFAYTPTLVAGSPAPTYSKVSGPTWASVNASTGQITGTPTGAPVETTIVVRATNTSGSADLTLPLSVIDGVAVTTTSLPGAVVGSAYAASLEAAGVAPLAWAITAGTLPAGLSLQGEVIAGTPTAAGSSTFTVQATDALGRTATRSLTLVVGAVADAIVITVVSLPVGTVGTAYVAGISADGAAPVTWQIIEGTLPPGLTVLTSFENLMLQEDSSLVTQEDDSSIVIDENAIYIVGTPTQPGGYGITVRATNAVGTATRGFVINIDAAAQPVASPWARFIRQ